MQSITRTKSLLYFFHIDPAVEGVPQVHVMGICEKSRSQETLLLQRADVAWEVAPDGTVTWAKNRFHAIPGPRTIEAFIAAVDSFLSAASRFSRTLVVEGSTVERTAGVLEAHVESLPEGR